MKVLARLHGNTVCIQVVKRGETVYIRRCARTMFAPTERQMDVRRTVAYSSMLEYDDKEASREQLSREDINRAVMRAFREWVPAEKKKTTIESILEEEYGTQVEDVKTTYGKLKTYNYP